MSFFCHNVGGEHKKIKFFWKIESTRYELQNLFSDGIIVEEHECTRDYARAADFRSSRGWELSGLDSLNRSTGTRASHGSPAKRKKKKTVNNREIHFD
jgi:activator of HSP90 ATPase